MIAPDILPDLLLALVAGALGGAMNALAGGGTFATLPALIALGLPTNIANATSILALLPGAGASAWAFRNELGPIGGVSWRVLAVITFVAGLGGSLLLIGTPGSLFDVIMPWLMLIAFLAIAFGRRAADWLHARVTIGARTLMAAQGLLGLYGGYFGGGVALMITATYGLLANIDPREMFAIRTVMLAVANLAAAILFIAFAMIDWRAALPMIVGAIIGGWLGALVGKRLPARAVRLWTLFVTLATTIVFFVRAYG